MINKPSSVDHAERRRADHSSRRSRGRQSLNSRLWGQGDSGGVSFGVDGAQQADQHRDELHWRGGWTDGLSYADSDLRDTFGRSVPLSRLVKVSRVRHMVPGGSRESLPKRKVRFADHPGVIAW